MESVRIYRNINAADQIFGLELADGGVMLLVFFLAFLFNRKGLFINILILLAIYIGLRILKRGKPSGYLLVLSRFVILSRFKRLPELDESEEVSSNIVKRRENTCP